MRAFLLASLSPLLLAAAAEAQSLEITTSSLPEANAGIAYSAPVAAANGTTPYAWSVAEGGLPGGLALDSGSGELSGTATLAETRSFVIEVTDAQGDTATRPFSLTVVPGAASQLGVTQEPGSGAAGAVISPHFIVRLQDAYGNDVAQSGVGVSVALSSGSGTLQGTTSRSTDGSGLAEFDDLVLETAGAKQLTATSGALTPVTSATFTVSAGAAATLAFAVPPSDVVAGATIAPAVEVRVADAYGNGVAGAAVSLSLVGTGTLSGGGPVPTNASGIASFGALGVDRAGTKQLSATTATLGPVVSAAFTVSCPAIAVSPPTLPAGTAGAPYGQTVSASGGATPYAYAITAGALPAGLTLDSGTGAIQGTPASPGAFSFTVTATDANACTGSTAYSLRICPVIDLSPASLAATTVGTSYSQTLSATAGTAPFAFSVVLGSLPPGLGLSSAGVISGTSTSTGSFAFTVGVQDAVGCGGSRAYTLAVVGVPAAIANLTAVRRTTGNDTDGTVKIDIAFTMPAFAATAEVYRAPFGHYPRYDDDGGATPPTPSYPPGPPWSITDVSASGQSDEPVGRDFYFYVVFTKNAAGAVSPVSNKTSGTANYHLGDFSDGLTPGAGDNLVGSADVSLLGAYYGMSGAAITAAGVDYLDVGPTTDLRLTSRPFTDRLINFEDLIVVASNYGSVSSPQLAAHAAREAARAAGGPERLSVTAPALADEGATFTATIELEAAGRLQGLSVELTWDAAIAEPLDLSSGGMLEAQGGLVLSPRRGVADAALLGLRDRGISGSGVLATVRFRALRSGDPAVRLGRVIGRDAENQPVDGGALATDDRLAAPARTLLFAPYPNPSSGESRLGFALARAAGVELAIYSVDGRRVRTLARGPLAAGSYHFTWSGDDDDHRPVAPGVYYARLTAGTARFTYELVQLR